MCCCCFSCACRFPSRVGTGAGLPWFPDKKARADRLAPLLRAGLEAALEVSSLSLYLPRFSSFQSPMFDGKVPHWYHFSCFWKVGHSIWQPDVEVDGFSELRWDDQQKVKKMAEAGGVAGPNTPTRGIRGWGGPDPQIRSFQGTFPEGTGTFFSSTLQFSHATQLHLQTWLCPSAGHFFPTLETWSFHIVVLID